MGQRAAPNTHIIDFSAVVIINLVEEAGTDIETGLRAEQGAHGHRIDRQAIEIEIAFAAIPDRRNMKPALAGRGGKLFLHHIGTVEVHRSQAGCTVVAADSDAVGSIRTRTDTGGLAGEEIASCRSAAACY